MAQGMVWSILFLHLHINLFYHHLLKNYTFSTELHFYFCQKSVVHFCVWLYSLFELRSVSKILNSNARQNSGDKIVSVLCRIIWYSSVYNIKQSNHLKL